VTLTPNLPDLLSAAFSAMLNGFYVALPGIIDEYNPATQLASVIPAVVDAYYDEGGNRATQSLPILPSVPVMFPGFGAWRITCPIKPGDTCLLVFSSAELGNFLATGQLAPKLTDQRNHLSDAVAIVGLRDLTKRLNPTPDDRMSLGTDDGCTIEIYPDEVRVGGVDASAEGNRIVVQSALAYFMAKLQVAIDALTTIVDPSASALQALQAALTNAGVTTWSAGTIASKAL
jgi:hypothetical protein